MSTKNIQRYIGEIRKALALGQDPREVANDYGIDSYSLQEYLRYHYGEELHNGKRVTPDERERRYEYKKERATEAQQAAEKERIKTKREAAQKEVSENPYLRAITGKTGSFKSKDTG